ncbi:hypothetical protein HYS93_02925 [Candidatus Daviesbacteria bacterium]|nr:hypothetical protein [Candidatus Daviesbacteria bacterium]
MLLKPNDLEELRQIYLKHYGIVLTDEQALELGIKLINLFKIVAKPIPAVDIKKKKGNNGNSDR